VRLNYFSLGSNMGDRGALLRQGVRDLVGSEQFRVSTVYQTAPWGGVEQEPFWNLVVELTSDATPSDLLERCFVAERAAMRVRDVRWGPRTLDVDLLLAGDLVATTTELTIPHPRMWQRRFVLAPLRELRPDLVDSAKYDAADGEVTNLGTLESLH
jgi:2-amino-4-hydroxy-6-hydroxymethyldihydropteridine diphosphokinase